MNTYIARQPIFDTQVKIYAYELLYRNDAKAGAFADVDADYASSRVVMESFHTIGLDAVTGGKPAFINFTARLLEENIATLFPKDHLVVEVLEDVAPTPEIVKICRELVARGYVIALDDFVYKPELRPLIDLAQIIKFDFLQQGTEGIRQMIRTMGSCARDKILLAEKVENDEVFKQAAAMGCTLFQGYFFSKPVTLAAKRIDPLKTNYLRLIKEMNSGNEIDFVRLAQTIRDDVALSYSLLKLVNSAYYGMRASVTTIKHALTILGVREIRKWISLMAMIGLSSDKPDEIIRMSMIRGFFMEQMGAKCKVSEISDSMFMVGLFSLIDVLVDQPRSVALADMVLTDEIADALLNNNGRLYDMLNLVISVERGDWKEADQLSAEFGVSMEQVSEVYLQSVKWCDELLV